MTALRILIVAVVQTLALGYMIADRQAVLNSARVVTLKVAPVDPRDPLRGDFVILRYDISSLDTKTLEGEDEFNPTDTIYVTLTAKGEDWTAAAVGHKPVPLAGGVVIKGTVSYAWDSDKPQLNVDYGIESFFVPQGKGLEIEQERQKGDLTADIAITADGRAIIKAIRRKSEVFYVEGIL